MDIINKIKRFLFGNKRYNADIIKVKRCLPGVLIPTKDTMYKMLIASYVTTDNIQIVNDAIKTNLQDYLNMLGEAVKNMR